MRKNNQFTNGEITIIGAGTVVEGVLKVTSSARIDGTVNGDITSTGVVVIANEGVVNGDITAVDVKISGTVKGNISSSGKTEVVSHGKLIGDISTGSLSIDETAVFQGSCKMNGVAAENPTMESAAVVEEATETQEAAEDTET